MKFAINGSNGFLGKHFISQAILEGHTVIPFSYFIDREVNDDSISELNINGDIDCFVHFAGLAHQKSFCKKQIYNVNVEYPKLIAKKVIKSKIKKFIFISSIGVHGSISGKFKSINEYSPYSPENIYSYTKLLAEESLKNLFRNTNTDLTILRPPLIFGNSAIGNWLKLKNYIYLGLPFPDIFSGVYKSLISVEELTKLILLLSSRFQLPKISYVVSHPDPIKLSLLIDSLYLNKFKYSRRIKLPYFISYPFLKMPNNIVNNLSKSLVLDPSNIMKDLPWEPTNIDLRNQINKLK